MLNYNKRTIKCWIIKVMRITDLKNINHINYSKNIFIMRIGCRNN